jgi:hypothetical protein
MRSGSHCTVHIAAVPVTDLGLQKEQCEVTLTGTLPDQGLSSGIGSFSERRRVAFSGFAYQGRPALHLIDHRGVMPGGFHRDGCVY